MTAGKQIACTVNVFCILSVPLGPVNLDDVERTYRVDPGIGQSRS